MYTGSLSALSLMTTSRKEGPLSLKLTRGVAWPFGSGVEDGAGWLAGRGVEWDPPGPVLSLWREGKTEEVEVLGCDEDEDGSVTRDLLRARKGVMGIVSGEETRRKSRAE